MGRKEIVLETERLILRHFTEKDMEAVQRIFGDEEVNRFLPWFPVKSRAEAEKFFQERYAGPYESGNGRHYAVCLRSDNIPIGYVNISGNEILLYLPGTVAAQGYNSLFQDVAVKFGRLYGPHVPGVLGTVPGSFCGRRTITRVHGSHSI